jgi:hypothetical protein
LDRHLDFCGHHGHEEKFIDFLRGHRHDLKTQVWQNRPQGTYTQRTSNKDLVLNVSTILIISALLPCLAFFPPIFIFSSYPPFFTFASSSMSPEPPAVQDSSQCYGVQNQIHNGRGPCQPLDPGEQQSPGQRKSYLDRPHPWDFRNLIWWKS